MVYLASHGSARPPARGRRCRRSRSCELTPPGAAAAARRRRHQVADHRRVRVLFRRLHRARCRTTTRWSSPRRAADRASFGCGKDERLDVLRRGVLPEGPRAAPTRCAAAFDVAKVRVAERETRRGASRRRRSRNGGSARRWPTSSRDCASGGRRERRDDALRRAAARRLARAAMLSRAFDAAAARRDNAHAGRRRPADNNIRRIPWFVS